MSGGAAGQSSGAAGAGGGCSPLALTATSSLVGVEGDGTESFKVALSLSSAGCTVAPTRAPVLFATAGGFAFEVVDPVTSMGSFFGVTSIEQGKTYPLPLQFVWSSPVTHALFRLDTASSSVLAVAPVLRAGFATPADAPFAGDGALTLQGPIETIPLSTGETWLGVIGQLANLSSDAASATGLSATVLDASGAKVVDVPVAPVPDAFVTSALAPFLGGAAVPAAAASLRVGVALTIGSTPTMMLERTLPIVATSPASVAPPVNGTWTWRNGPGEGVYHTHVRFPEQRYAYDLVITASGATYAGDPAISTSYHCFGQPIRAAHGGKVVLVDDTVPDNLGNTPSPANDPPKKNGQVIVDHGDGRVALYVHVQQGSAKVKVGDTVNAGDVLALVGNSGFTTEPHLHFEILETDATGRAHAVPIMPSGLVDAAGKAVVGVPKGGLAYTAP
jgi:hypothetical protein